MSMGFPRVGLRLLSAAGRSKALWLRARSSGPAVVRLNNLRFKSTDVAEEDLEGPEPPNGFLFNEKPLLPGEKRQKEEWENVWYWGMGINFLLILAIAVFKPDTSTTDWARRKAEERLSSRETDSENAGSEDQH